MQRKQKQPRRVWSSALDHALAVPRNLKFCDWNIRNRFLFALIFSGHLRMIKHDYGSLDFVCQFEWFLAHHDFTNNKAAAPSEEYNFAEQRIISPIISDKHTFDEYVLRASRRQTFDNEITIATPGIWNIEIKMNIATPELRKQMELCHQIFRKHGNRDARYLEKVNIATPQFWKHDNLGARHSKNQHPNVRNLKEWKGRRQKLEKQYESRRQTYEEMELATPGIWRSQNHDVNRNAKA